MRAVLLAYLLLAPSKPQRQLSLCWLCMATQISELLRALQGFAYETGIAPQEISMSHPSVLPYAVILNIRSVVSPQCGNSCQCRSSRPKIFSECIPVSYAKHCSDIALNMYSWGQRCSATPMISVYLSVPAML
ncbi:hypothetical protein JAAARDRAFT_302259 [Jaapia argillacea MUCL 33604]|uniref:Uncharacterized protein n=1 Tax=Jaapia argillacea MUCL 33604 TaxID=933084 RepID=A0A067PZX7_9AGAM|nr:hypothetical protein JAAARDRAFT_302259 [Jaapia argillacea MUCL 33604]